MWSATRPSRFTSGTHWIGGWVGPWAGLGDVKKRNFLTLPGLELRPLGRPARSQSLYRPRYSSFTLPPYFSILPSGRLAPFC
jgi:hypothetical protein